MKIIIITNNGEAMLDVNDSVNDKDVIRTWTYPTPATSDTKLPSAAAINAQTHLVINSSNYKNTNICKTNNVSK